MVRKILQSGDRVLRAKAKPVSKVDKKTAELIRDLKDTLAVQKDPEGVGLAAPQIGKSLQVFAASYKDFKRIVINPKIVKIIQKRKGKKEPKSSKEILEGCLSLPYYYGPLKRAYSITLDYLNEKGEKVTETSARTRHKLFVNKGEYRQNIVWSSKKYNFHDIYVI